MDSELSGSAEIIVGDCIEKMREMDAECVDAVVCDPPYFLHFMGRSWDRSPSPKEQQEQHYRWAVEALRVLRPGGYLLAFGGTRTVHRLAWKARVPQRTARLWPISSKSSLKPFKRMSAHRGDKKGEGRKPHKR